MAAPPLTHPIEPMLAKAAESIPDGDGWLFEPKWDGFRALVFKDGDDIYTQSRDSKPLDRYFPELGEIFRAQLPRRCVLDGEIVIAGPRGLEFESLQLRLHPAASRVKKLAAEMPSSFVAFDLLAFDDHAMLDVPQLERRRLLEELMRDTRPPLHLTPMTRDREIAQSWFTRFEGAGLDGVMAKRLDGTYQPGKRSMIKVKHIRSADCVVAGFRWHKNGPGTHVGSLLLGLYDDAGTLQNVGVTSAFTMAVRQQLAIELVPLTEGALDGHLWAGWASPESVGSRMPGGQSRWSQGKDLSWQAIRIERVCEVKYDHLQGDRFRHAAHFLRWRPDKTPRDCRYDQLEVTPPYELSKIFGGAS
jgi:ATP-dependent DNA ligase